MINNSTFIYNIGQSFYQMATKFEDNSIFKYADYSVTYGEVNKISNQFANYLNENKISKGDVVCIFNNKSEYGYAIMLACLKIGAIYVNVDYTSPEERLIKIIDRCKPSIILSEFDDSKVGTNKIQIVNDDFKKHLSSYADTNLEITNSVTGKDPAYIMYTSGSTGFPKGAIMSHQNILNFIQWSISKYEITENDIMTNANPIYFDNSVFDFYSAVFSGASLAPIKASELKDPQGIVKFVNEQQCTIWFSVPSLLVYLLTTKSLTESDFQSMRVITFGGEGFPKTKLKKLYGFYGHRIKLVNVYGPTECTCICSSYDISEKNFEDMTRLAPLGKISPNFDFEIIPNGDDVNKGELCLKGPHVGLGYFNDNERTKQSFIQNPYNSSYNEVIYKTGDLVECDANGELHFLGRVDNQIKHMGYRIELEEIEAAFNSLSYVNEVGVIYHKMAEGLGQILAFASISNNKEPKEILQDISKIIPPYMLPRSIKIVDTLPKNRNGKIDRGSLKNINK